MISSTSNQQIKKIVQLQKKSKARNESKTFVIEGIKMYGEIPHDKIVMTYVNEAFAKEDENLKQIQGEYEIVADSVFKEISETMTPQGIMAIAKQPEYNIDDILKKQKLRILFLDDIRDPGNMGTIIRTSEGAGMDAVVISGQSVDMFNPKVIRSTMGAIYRVPFVIEDNLCEAIKNRYIKAGITFYAAHLKGAVNYTEVDYANRCGLIIGNEANGISDDITSLSDVAIKIPMEGQLESLNAGVSAALIMYEVYRRNL